VGEADPTISDEVKNNRIYRSITLPHVTLRCAEVKNYLYIININKLILIPIY